MSYTTNTGSSTIIHVPAPEGGAHITVACGAQSGLHFAFDPSAASITRPEGSDDLAFALDEGGTVTLHGFFSAFADAGPDLVFPDGAVVGAADFFAAAGLELFTQSGPEAGAALSGSGPRYNDSPGELLEGVAKLGKLELSPGGRPGERDERAHADPIAPAVLRAARGAGADGEGLTNGENPEDGGGAIEEEQRKPVFVAEPDELRVHEDGLPGGAHPGADGHPTAANGSLAIASADALTSIAIGGLTLTITGIALDGTVSYLVAGESAVPHGEFIVTGLSWSGGVYTLCYSYTLQEASPNHTDNSAATGGHEELPDAIAIQVTATDARGDTVEGDIKLQIHDDAPSQLAPDAVALYADTGLIEASLNAVWGADGPSEGKGLYFSPKGEPAADGGYPSGLTSHGAPVSFHLSEDGATLTAVANGETVFIVRLDGKGNAYTVELSGAIDPGIQEDVLQLGGASPGNGAVAYLNTDPSSPAIAYAEPGPGHLVATVTGGTADGPGTLNNNKDCMGVNNQSFDAGQWMLFAFEKPQNALTINSPANRIKGVPKGEWVAYDENGLEVARGEFAFDESGTMTIDTGPIVFYDIKLTMTDGSCGVGTITCNSSKEYLDALVELPVEIMDADGDTCAGGIDITFKPGDEPAPGADAAPAYAEPLSGPETPPDADALLAAMAAAEDGGLFIPKTFGTEAFGPDAAPAPEAGEALRFASLLSDAPDGAEPLDALLAALPPEDAERAAPAGPDATAPLANGEADAGASGWTASTVNDGPAVCTNTDASLQIIIESGLGIL